METVSTKTFYNYVHQGKTSIKPIDLPRITLKTWTSKAIPLSETFAVLGEMFENDDGRVNRTFDV